MTERATGTFEVELTPQPLADGEADAALGRLAIAKQFYGDLTGTSRGEMLSVKTHLPDSAGYVATEKVTGTLHGRRGTFVLQHSATVNRGEHQLTIAVVPDSGTGELAGLSGLMTILIDAGHRYVLEYALKTTPQGSGKKP